MELIVRSGIIVVGILFIRKWGMGKISRKLQYYTWGFLPVVLLISPYFKIPVLNIRENESKPTVEKYSEASYINENTFEESLFEGEYFHDNLENNLEEREENDLAKGDKEKNQTKVRWKFFYEKNALENISKIITIILFCFILITNGIFAVKLLKRRIFLKKDELTKLKIYLLEECGSPFLFGKSIYLHPNMTKDEESMHYMILHEYCHLKQGDLLFCLMKYIMCAVYWFNPFIWVAIYFISRDCELACDEAVIKIIGMNKQRKYGMTLLELFKEKRRNKGYVIGTFMGGKRSMLRERITFLSKPLYKNKRKGWTFGVLAGCFLLMGCSLIGNNDLEERQGKKEPVNAQKRQENRENEEVNKITQISLENSNVIVDTKEQSSNEMFPDLGNIYYNSVKENKGNIYFTQSDYLCCMDLNSKVIRQLEKGKFRLGSICENYLYYLKYPTGSEEKSGIGRMNLLTMEQEMLIPWDEAYWSCTEIFLKDNILYLGLEKGCKAFFIDQEKTIELDEKDNLIVNAIAPFAKLIEEAPTINFGYINSIFNFHVFGTKDSKTNILYICNTEGKKIVKKENCLGDVLVSEKGVIYTALNGDIYLSPLDNLDEDKLLFSVEKNGAVSVTYGTYDQNGLYVFENQEGTLKCKCILWEGGIVSVKEFSDIRLSIDSKLSAFTDYVVYFENDEINLKKIGGKQ